MFDPWILVQFAAPAVLVLLALAILWRLAAQDRARDDETRGAIREAAELRTRVDGLHTQLGHAERDIRQDLANARAEQAQAAAGLRTEVGGAIGKFRDTTQQQLTDMAGLQQRQLASFGEQLAKLTQSSEQRLDAVRIAVEQRLDALRNDNAAKLEAMRATVDEKLQTTLEKRLGDSFKQVSERLEQVHRGLGEMQSLAIGVGDLKRVLANVKTRGMWGEVQLAALLAEVLTPQQYAANVETVPGSNQRVEFAIRLPGRGDGALPCWLPIDAKFPLEEWQRLQDALESADLPAAEAARRALAEFLRAQAKGIRAAYVSPPHTTDFAILFVPTEGLYAEMMARPGFAETLQHDYRVTLTGPTNFLALLNSLQMGFRTLAIEQRSSEVWRVLGAVKTEFAKFGDVIAKAKERLDQASRTLDQTGARSRAIERQLRGVESMPDDDAQRVLDSSALLGADDVAPDDAK
ncbi:MAG: DNA recombination protein RmuC [Burkholderiales bacterium]|nr:DNA recombination protein RmuC [Burkholderiales bacterium]